MVGRDNYVTCHMWQRCVHGYTKQWSVHNYTWQGCVWLDVTTMWPVTRDKDVYVATLNNGSFTITHDKDVWQMCVLHYTWQWFMHNNT